MKLERRQDVLGASPQTPGIYRMGAINKESECGSMVVGPDETMGSWLICGFVNGPASALGLLPSRALSSVAASSV
mgnify:CR=1 FL=1